MPSFDKLRTALGCLATLDRLRTGLGCLATLDRLRMADEFKGVPSFRKSPKTGRLRGLKGVSKHAKTREIVSIRYRCYTPEHRRSNWEARE